MERSEYFVHWDNIVILYKYNQDWNRNNRRAINGHLTFGPVLNCGKSENHDWFRCNEDQIYAAEFATISQITTEAKRHTQIWNQNCTGLPAEI